MLTWVTMEVLGAGGLCGGPFALLSLWLLIHLGLPPPPPRGILSLGLAQPSHLRTLWGPPGRDAGRGTLGRRPSREPGSLGPALTAVPRSLLPPAPPAPWGRWAGSSPSSGTTSTSASTWSSTPCCSTCSRPQRMPTSTSPRSPPGRPGPASARTPRRTLPPGGDTLLCQCQEAHLLPRVCC